MARSLTKSTDKTIAIGAVSRLLGVSTHALRKWETRYGAISPARSEGGDRRYSQEDVDRLVRLATLVAQGHAIGTIASLSDEALDEILGSKRAVESPAVEALRCVVVGSRLWAELEPASDRLQHISLVGLADELDGLDRSKVDALIAEIPALGRDTRATIQMLRDKSGVDAIVVVYRYGSVEVAESLSDARTAVLSRPMNIRELERTLRAICIDPGRPLPPVGLPPHRFSRRALADIAMLSPALACECPRHVAQILIELSDFESYSADCENTKPDDAVVHSMLRRTAATARSLFEDALVDLASHEDIDLNAL